MSIWGTILGGAAGFALGGPLGALVGGAVGGIISDPHIVGAPDAEEEEIDPRQQIGFTIAVIALSAKLAKADGKVTDDELRAFHRVFSVPPHETRNVDRVFERAHQSTFGYTRYAEQVADMFFDRPAVLEEVMNCLFFIAGADGAVSAAELDFLRDVSEIFGFTDDDFARLREEHMGAGDADPYTVLGVGRGAGDDAIKKIYRRLVRENHPDKLIAQGMPEEFVEVANQKLAAINAAYDRICAERAIR